MKRIENNFESVLFIALIRFIAIGTAMCFVIATIMFQLL